MAPAGRLYGGCGPAPARRDPDHRGTAFGRPWPRRQGQLDVCRPQCLLRRLRAASAARRRTGRSLRGPAPGPDRSGSIRGWRRGRSAGHELRRADRRPCRAGSGRRSGQPGRAGRRGQRLSARAALERTGDLGRERRHVQPHGAPARWPAHGSVRVACGLVGSGSAHAAGGGGDRPACPRRIGGGSRRRGRGDRGSPEHEPDRARGHDGRGADVRGHDRLLLHRRAVSTAGGGFLGAWRLGRARGRGAARRSGGASGGKRSSTAAASNSRLCSVSSGPRSGWASSASRA